MKKLWEEAQHNSIWERHHGDGCEYKWRCFMFDVEGYLCMEDFKTCPRRNSYSTKTDLGCEFIDRCEQYNKSSPDEQACCDADFEVCHLRNRYIKEEHDQISSEHKGDVS